jgi:arabinogalactan endo-1,4-beta-galactosidase
MLSNFHVIILSITTLACAAIGVTGAKPGYTFYKGHDLSSLKREEARGVTYKDTLRRNITRPLENILGDGGMNSVRLR